MPEPRQTERTGTNNWTPINCPTVTVSLSCLCDYSIDNTDNLWLSYHMPSPCVASIGLQLVCEQTVRKMVCPTAYTAFNRWQQRLKCGSVELKETVRNGLGLWLDLGLGLG